MGLGRDPHVFEGEPPTTAARFLHRAMQKLLEGVGLGPALSTYAPLLGRSTLRARLPHDEAEPMAKLGRELSVTNRTL